jgi:hypothetical protein
MNNKARLFLIRGIPGSGKTRFAKKFSCLHVDPLMFFEKHSKFEYDNQLIHYAHGFCKDIVSKCMNEGIDVVVSNTFAQNWELAWYKEQAIQKGYDLVIYTMPSLSFDYTEVPYDHIEHIERIWEPVDGEVFIL